MTSQGQEQSPVVLSAEEREAVLNGIRGLPPELRNAQLAKLLGRSVHDPKLAREFRANPRESFEMCGVHIPDGLVVEVHYQTPKSLHVTLPSAELASQQRGGGPLEITDADLVTTVETLSYLDDDNWTSDGRDPTTARDVGDDPGGWSDVVQDHGRKADGGRDPRANNDA